IATRPPPLSTLFPYTTLFRSGGQVYVPTTTVLGGAHALLVVGYDEPGRYWIVKNSWGTGWGDQGFGKVSYDANLLEPAGFAGLRSEEHTSELQSRSDLVCRLL